MSRRGVNVRRTSFGRSTKYAFSMLILLFSAAPNSARGELTKPPAKDRYVSTTVAELLKHEHLTRQQLDDAISRRAIKHFFKSMDPMKVYFMQSDIDEFMTHRDRVDDFVKKGDLRFAYDVFRRFLKRVDERISNVDSVLQHEFDFTKDEYIKTDPDEVQYAQSQQEIDERWRKRIKHDLLVLKSDDTVGEEATERISRRYNSFAKRMRQVDSDEMLEMFLTSATTSFDPHTTYMSPSSLENFHIAMKLNLEGIGAALYLKDGYTVVKEIIPGGAADKAGQLKPEDRIVSVGQDVDGEMVDVVDMKLGDVVKLIRGKKETIVRLGVIPGGSNEQETYQITRAKIELKDSEARSEIFSEGQKADGTPYRIGVINLPSFYMDMNAARKGFTDFKSTTRDVRRILEEFKTSHIDLCMLDLRRNGGGSLTEAINLTGLFIDHGPVVQVKDSAGRVQHYDDLDGGVSWNGPLVVLIDKFSASASEILAGAIQDYNRGLIVGDRSTHGKGTVQSLLDLGSQLIRVKPPNLGALKITMQQFYRPSGASTQKRGVESDIVLPSITTHMDIGEGDLDFAVDFDTVAAVPHADYRLIYPQFITELRTRTQARQDVSEDFSDLRQNIARYREQKERKAVTLNEKQFFEEREELDADQEEEEELEEKHGEDRPVFDRENFYNNEVINISLDYLKLLDDPKLAEVAR